MENNDLPPFYVGQEVVANSNHHQNTFKKGDEFIVQSILKCGKEWAITIGINRYGRCRCCGKISYTHHFYANRFSPKHKFGAFISMKEFTEKQLEIIGVN
jgi:hypothetical protein